jgi:hypothetical protein
MRRRDFLALSGVAAGLVGLAGCAGQAGTRTLPTPLTDDPDPLLGASYRLGEEATVESTTVAVLDATVRRSEHYRTASGTLDIYAPSDSRLVSVRATAEGESRPPLSAFGLRVGGTTHPAQSSVEGRPRSAVLSRYDSYDPDAEPDPNSRLLLFELPATAAEDADPTATLRVQNSGNVDGTLRAALNYAGSVDAAETLSVSVPAGETTTREYDLPWSGRRLEVELAWAGPHEQRTIEPEGG